MFNPDKAVEQLLQVYQRGYLRLYETIIAKEARGNVTQYQRALLRDTQRVLKQLDETTLEWAKQVMPKVYRMGQDETNQILLRAGRETSIQAGFGRVHQQTISVLVENLYENLHNANQFVGRRIQDTFRRTALQVLTDRQATGETLRQAKTAFLQRLGEQGLTAFRDARGREWRLDAYADMVVRSTTAEANSIGKINQLRATGNDLVQFSRHANPCEICAPLEGRVYSISGEDDRFPALDIAHSEGYANIHPNCRHVLVPYVEELDDNPSQTVQQSNRSFERDPRTQAEKNRYEAAQRLNAQKRETRKQWERYKAYLPDDVPNLAAFTRMKNADSDRYRELQQLLREVSTTTIN